MFLLRNNTTSSVAIGKARAVCAQSFALWQQATIEITRHDHSIIACSRHLYILLFFAHIPCVVNHTINTTPTERLQQHPLLFTTNRTNRTFFVWRLNPTRPSQSWSQHHFVDVSRSVTHKHELWIWFTLSYAMMKTLLRLTTVWDTKQTGDLRGDTVQFIASSAATVLMTQNGNISHH